MLDNDPKNGILRFTWWIARQAKQREMNKFEHQDRARARDDGELKWVFRDHPVREQRGNMMDERKFRTLFCNCAIASASLAATSFSSTAMAQQQAPSAVPLSMTTQEPTAPSEQNAASGLGQIVVTAQRREQNLQRIPVAVTAISGAELESRNIQNPNALIGVVPGFAIRDAGATVQYNLRGYISTDARAIADGPVAVYVDDVFLASTTQQQMQTFDVDRVEALRGPQGTLFGRNATGGLIHFISKKPTDELNGTADIQYGSFNQVIADGAIGGPITSAIDGRIAIKYNRDDGWQKNELGGKNRDAKNAIAGRAQLKANLAPNLVANLSFQEDHERNQYEGYSSFGALNSTATAECNYQQIVALQCFLGGAPFSNVPAGNKSLATYDPTRIYSTLKSDPDHFDAQLAIGRLDWNVAPVLKLSSITSWARAHRSFIEDDNSTGLTNNNDYNLISHNYSSSQFSQEERASGRLHGVNYVAGVYYLNSTKHSAYLLLDDSATTVIDDLYPLERLKTETVAGFAQVEVPLTSTLTAIGGGRETWERKTLYRQVNPGFGTLGPLESLPRSSGSLTKFTGKAGIQYQPTSRIMAYGTYSTGFKSGEYPSDITNAPLVLVKPETISAFEIGAKTSFLRNRIRLNVAGYVNNIENKQSVTSIRDAATGAQVDYFINFGGVRQKGFEVELAAKPISSLTLGATVAYVDNSIRPNAGVTIERLAFYNEYTLSGNELPGVPPWQETVSADWRLPVQMRGAVTAHVDWRWQNTTFWNISNNPVEREPSYNVGNLSITYALSGGRYSLMAFVNNVTDKYYSTVNFSFGGSDVLTVQWARPRWAGVRAGVSF